MATEQLRFDTGRVCLDLLTTVGSRLSERPIERLDSTARLREWLTGSGLVPAGQHPRIEERWLEDVKRLRSLLHRIIHAELSGNRASGDDLRRLGELAAVAPPAPSPRRERDGELRLRLVEPITLPALGSAVCRDAIELLTGEDRAYLRQCEGETCDLVYIDRSRGRRRRWCSSQACGNRQRVAEHRSRAREQS